MANLSKIVSLCKKYKSLEFQSLARIWIPTT